MSQQDSIAAGSLKTNQNYWFWLTEKGLSGNAEIHFYTTEEDETGLFFYIIRVTKQNSMFFA